MKYIILTLLLYSCSADSDIPNVNRIARVIPDAIVQKSAEVSFYHDSDFPETEFRSISAELTSGFDTTTDFRIMINDSLLSSFSCKTNYSVNRCIYEENDSTKIAGFTLYLDTFCSEDTLSIRTDNEIVKIVMADTMKLYNRLKIGKFDNMWELYFTNSSRPINLQ
jgi:hypothetical protein